MDTTEILRAFAAAEGMPVEAIRAWRARKPRRARAGARAGDRQVCCRRERDADADALFFVFHLLGEWREKSAYRPLAALLRLPDEDVTEALSDAKTETSHRVMAAVFDGDPAPLRADHPRSGGGRVPPLAHVRGARDGDLARRGSARSHRCVPARLLSRACAARRVLRVGRLAERDRDAGPRRPGSTGPAGIRARVHLDRVVELQGLQGGSRSCRRRQAGVRTVARSRVRAVRRHDRGALDLVLRRAERAGQGGRRRRRADPVAPVRGRPCRQPVSERRPQRSVPVRQRARSSRKCCLGKVEAEEREQAAAPLLPAPRPIAATLSRTIDRSRRSPRTTR